MAKKRDEKKPLTLRQQQSQKIMREKAAQARRENFLRKLRIFLAVFLPVVLIGGGFWCYKTSAHLRLVKYVSDSAYGATADAGYKIKDIYLEGRDRTPLATVNEALDIDMGYPILRLNLAEIRTRLEAVESIKTASVDRALPSTLYVRIVEREPVARWQYQGKISLVDENGAVMKGLDIAPYGSLPLIVGEDAPENVGSLLDLLVLEPSLAGRFVAAIWVGDRRWNIRLRREEGEGDIEVRLPEKDPDLAWKKLADMEAKEKVLERTVEAIDLRLQGRMFIKVPEEKPEDAGSSI